MIKLCPREAGRQHTTPCGLLQWLCRTGAGRSQCGWLIQQSKTVTGAHHRAGPGQT